ncbi:hypothetical protein [Enterococcus sp. AZ062]|uniref:hypothetical protein n=1 Tax=Enterococcus sp. AZ062 TaxID=2774692 RepID=UPI003F291782
MTDETLKDELAETLEDHILNIESVHLLTPESIKYLYESLVCELKELVEEISK